VLPNFDLRVLVDLNSLNSANNPLAPIWDFMLLNPLVRGIPIFLPLVALWFAADSPKRRSRMMSGLLAAVLSVAVSVVCQCYAIIHLRPFLDPALHLQGINPAWGTGWARPGSFPSDTATLIFALAMVIFIENRTAGIIAFLATLLTVGVDRVVLGWHYPSDIAAGLALGAGLVYLFSRFAPLNAAFERLLACARPRIYLVHAFLFLFLADAYALFPGGQGVLHVLKIAAAGLIHRH